MTTAVMGRFGATTTVLSDGTYRVEPTGYRSTRLTIEPDASAASYFLAAAAIVGGSVRIAGLGRNSLQGDIAFADVLERMGVEVRWESDGVVATRDLARPLRGINVDMADISDTAQTLAVVAAFAEGATTIDGIGFIRSKETDRIAATVSELQRCGVRAEELLDGIRIDPVAGTTPRAASIRTYDDHRMAMSFALIGLRVPGIEILDPECVAKTFPQYLGRPRLTVGAHPVTVIAIDGPAGSGKSTIAAALAARLGLEVLDTGAMYRAVTYAVLAAGVDPVAEAEASDIAVAAAVEMRDGTVRVNGTDATSAIRGPEVSAAVSIVAAYPVVRSRLRDLQRQWMKDHGGGVVEGRDIGTVVFPDAELKVFLVADPTVRAQRRAGDGHLDAVQAAANISERDRLDSSRSDSPLAAADDSVVVDTSLLSVDEVLDEVLAHLSEAHR